MKHLPLILAAVALLCPRAAAGQDSKKWKPYQFVGNERYDYKVVMSNDEEKKESGWILDLRKKGAEDFEVTQSYRNVVKKTLPGPEILAGSMGLGMSPIFFLMNPAYSAFLEQLELKEGEKLSLFGAGMIKVTAKETVGGRTGYTCKFFTKQEDKDVLACEWTIDPELALPLRSVTYEGGKEKFRFDLLSYKKD